ncbi:M3 family oligoendopeptidase [uncultured Endozoicomonas sp.]|uniref:M3 family oligoendopeptidase n=1 Tax=uncultured Endozoicomonas sp. TaxID=432652 RepID=UPI002624AFA5|nr:M3 family oligoendopeptidase [uncultured Endozoicomonas sp.]
MSIDSDNTIPVWNNTHIYKDFNDPALQQDIETISTICDALNDKALVLEDSAGEDLVRILVEAIKFDEKASILCWTASTFASSISSVDAKNDEASRLDAKTNTLSARIEQAFKPFKQYLLKAPDDLLEKVFSDDDAAGYRFYFQHQRKRNVHLLSTEEEVAISALSVDGLHSWWRLYNELRGSLRCQVGGEEIGLASAFNLTLQQDSVKRKQAWDGIQNAWGSREETAAAILNAVNGWRNEESQLRSKIEPVHYLDVSCHRQKIERSTLDALIGSTEAHLDIGHRALKGMAKGLGLDKLGPQDLHAPFPSAKSDAIGYRTFSDSIDLVANAFARLDPAMGEFARTMYKKGWIDAKPSDNRTTGAYCAKFPKVGEPRVFMTWDGSISNVITLAHELGHAWHNWVMKDLSFCETIYPSTLAETASIFAETLVRDALAEHASTDHERLETAWLDAERASAFLVNIPARFEFEKKLVEARAEGYVPASQLTALMNESWAKWYQDSISGYDPLFWAAKLHFSISGMSFYNYPYLFGYLFSLGIYAKKERYGDQFSDVYRGVLMDTGRMTAEELIEKHFDQDIRQPAFWNESLDIVDQQILRFEELLDKIT